MELFPWDITDHIFFSEKLNLRQSDLQNFYIVQTKLNFKWKTKLHKINRDAINYNKREPHNKR